MFFFGFFTSQVPYIVFAFAYMMYLGAYTLNRAGQGEDVLLNADPVKTITYQASTQQATVFQYVQNIVAENVAVPPLPQVFAVVVDTGLPPGSHLLPDSYIFSSVFSRPPPALS